MTSARFGTINLDTGEIMESGVPVWVGKKVHVGERFFMGFQDAFIEISQDQDMTKESLRIMHYMMGNLDFENFIQISQAKISKDLSIKKQNVSKALKLICEKQILLAGPKIGRSLSYRMNFRYGWKGKVSNLKKHKKNHLDLAVDNCKVKT